MSTHYVQGKPGTRLDGCFWDDLTERLGVDSEQVESVTVTRTAVDVRLRITIEQPAVLNCGGDVHSDGCCVLGVWAP